MMKPYDISEIKKFALNALVFLSDDSISEEEIDARFFHSMRVSNNAIKIAEGLGLEDYLADCALFAGLCHDIAKLNKSNVKHGMVARNYLKENIHLVPDYFKKMITDKRVMDAISFHSEKFCYYGKIDENVILNIVKDADMVDKLCYDALTKSVASSVSLTDKLDKLYCKREHINRYIPATSIGLEMIKKGMEKLDLFIAELEDCRIDKN